MRVHEFGWTLEVDGLVTDRFGSFFLHLLNFLSCFSVLHVLGSWL